MGMTLVEVAESAQRQTDEAAELRARYREIYQKWKASDEAKNEHIVRLESYNDLKSETIADLQREVERHKTHKARIIAVVQKAFDTMDAIQQEIHAIKFEDEAQPKKDTNELLKKLADELGQPRGLQDVLADHKDERPIPAFMMERT